MENCIIFGGHKNQSGYGRQFIKGKRVVVSRFIWEQFNGPIPSGYLVCHTCDNPSCVNIKHLFLGTHKDNSDDMFNKGRDNFARGEKQGLSKVTEDEVLKIKALDLPQRTIAKMFNVSQKAIWQIKNNKTWKHV